MDATEKQILRAQLLASGVIRYWKWDKSKYELDRWLQVLAEELGIIKGSTAELRIRENLLTYGLRVPEVSTPVHVESPIALQATDAIGDSSESKVCSRLPEADSRSSTVHPQGVQVLQNSDTPRASEVVESTDVKGDFHLGHGFDKGATKQACRTGKRMHSESKPLTSPHLSEGAGSKVQQNAGHETDQSLKTRFTLVDPSAGSQPQVNGNGSTGSWTWRNSSYNRVPPAIEQAICERFKQGWSKSRLPVSFD
jgi:hypothetical protein